MRIKDEIKKQAEKMARKACSDDYVEDGGYIRDWLALDIEEALLERHNKSVEMCADEAELARDIDRDLGSVIRALKENP